MKKQECKIKNTVELMGCVLAFLVIAAGMTALLIHALNLEAARMDAVQENNCKQRSEHIGQWAKRRGVKNPCDKAAP